MMGTQVIRFNSRAPRGARRLGQHKAEHDKVSIHAPRVGRDASYVARSLEFIVSIHAPRVGRDGGRDVGNNLPVCFNSRAPRGARLKTLKAPAPATVFQFTRPAWGATLGHRVVVGAFAVSIHAPRVGRDGRRRNNHCYRICFNSRAPRGARRQCRGHRVHRQRFNSRAPRGARLGVPESG